MQGFTYTVDMVLCIDATGSMHPIIDEVKKSALSFYEDLTKAMAEKDKVIDRLRLRTIVYRDYFYDGDKSMITSDFFTLPDEKERFSDFVSGIKAVGGGDEPESGLEALALAMMSPWSNEGSKRRQVIVLWTDASAHKLEEAAKKKPAGYPGGMPVDFDALTDMWEGQSYMEQNAKRLVIYAPDAYAWTDIANYWENALHFPSAGGRGLEEFEYSEVLDTIAASI
jgi:hypothetical protein